MHWKPMSLVDYPTTSDSEDDSAEDGLIEKKRQRSDSTSRTPLTEPEKKQRRGESMRSNVDEEMSRIRQAPFVEGNWPTYVYCSFRPSVNLLDLIGRINQRASAMVPTTQFVEFLEGGLHISLSRTVFLKVFQIDRFVNVLTRKLTGRRRFSTGFTNITNYTNDDGSRSFLGIDVGHGQDELASLVKDVNSVIAQFRQDTFYDNPSFHASIAWTFGTALNGSVVNSMQDLDAELRHFQFPIDAVTCRIGNKLYSFPLEG
ncbi:uncharacterized protein SPPG_02231 [Spizellomyces punctatus DAOM BR117]|uniref:U6 snRNA phosphodiesterase n=1 Tax=Spizellomyces punctatus (strain DAOM BR117) TaxID=645134 RepID=A0A0L0HQE3_SPIPD|nr:uncharacterized protein SPPG_02231 [Spizellomyces punctatus DAOM BR117]KND03170.1 hypothetical protein SPPG_02231 [Spizellomyces punctatus DAOM BR117]|eukprot:XP_016611209.1 hypothetical protein SPPG_02231 [Spizellomyces punctatus DAOM BR117]